MTYTCPKGHPLRLDADSIMGTDASGHVYPVTMSCPVCEGLFGRNDDGTIVLVRPAEVPYYD